eukprot:346544-Prorocentrum_minimum.AAC.1
MDPLFRVVVDLSRCASMLAFCVLELCARVVFSFVDLTLLSLGKVRAQWAKTLMGAALSKPFRKPLTAFLDGVQTRRQFFHFAHCSEYFGCTRRLIS